MKTLTIHKTQKSDIDEIISMENDTENLKFILPNSKEEHFKLIDDCDIEHLVLKSDSDKIIGFVILAGIEGKNRSIEFRRIVVKSKGKGYGRMAIKKIKCYCFEKLTCHRLWLDLIETNERARYLYQSEGFKEEGRLRDCVLIDNKFNNLVIMSILENEYKSTTTSSL